MSWGYLYLVYILIFILPVWILYLDKFSQIALRKKLDGTWLGAFLPWASIFYGGIIINSFLNQAVIVEWLIITIPISLVLFLIPKNAYIKKNFYWFAYDHQVPTQNTLNSPYKKFIMCHWWANIIFLIYFVAQIYII